MKRLLPICARGRRLRPGTTSAADGSKPSTAAAPTTDV